MTVRDLLAWLGRSPGLLATILLIPPLLAFLLSRLPQPRPNTRSRPLVWRRYLYAGLVYLVCVPGTFAAVLTGYTLFFTRGNLLDVDPLVYLLPIVSMVVTLVLIGKTTSFADIPGFDRLQGFMVLLGTTFLIALAVHKTFIGVVFVARLAELGAIALVVFALLKWGSYTLFRRKDEPATKPPSLRW
jgi:hypothetical protein